MFSALAQALLEGAAMKNVRCKTGVLFVPFQKVSAELTLCLVIFAALARPALADPRIGVQKLFDVDVQVEPKLLPQDIYGKMPVRVLTTDNGNIMGFQFGLAHTQFDVKYRDGEENTISVPQISLPMDSLKKKIAIAKYGPWLAFSVDARGIDPARGGTVHLKYFGTLLGETNTVTARLQKVNGRWVAYAVQDGSIKPVGKPVGSAKIVTGWLGIGLEEPEYSYIDPNRLASELSIATDTNPAVTRNELAAGAQMMSDPSKPNVLTRYNLHLRVE